MSRTTQYIGLTDDAKEWLKAAVKVEVNPKMTLGMFNENVPGKIYHMPPPDGPNQELIAVETLQHSSWSSGPMLFTHLEMFLIKESGQKLSNGFAFSWVYDPAIPYDQEYDPIKGHYNV